MRKNIDENNIVANYIDCMRLYLLIIVITKYVNG